MADVNVYLTHHKHLSSGSLNLANLNVYWAIHSTRFQYFRIDFANFSFRSTRTLGIPPSLPHLHTPLTRKVLVARSKSQYSRAWNCSMNGNFKGATWARPANYLRSSLTSFACTNSARHSNFNHNN